MSDTSQKIYKAGEIILRQGDPGLAAYILDRGRVEISVLKPDGTTEKLGTRGPGSMIGEMSLIDKAPRTASVTALEECELLEITAEDFERRLSGADPVLKMTIQVIMARYRDILAREQGERAAVPKTETLEKAYLVQSEALGAIKIANDFKEALERRDIMLHYQPIIDLRSGAIAGFEALMRWNHPEKGFIPPGVFIPVIEDNGLIIPATHWALDEALSALKRITKSIAGHDHLFMSVNFASQDFCMYNFLDGVMKALHTHDVKPGRLHLEITERVLMGQPDVTQQTLEKCREAGMMISIDDFGTGYSSLSYLHRFPISTLKIDRSFVKDMTSDKGAMELVKSILNLSHNMKMDIIAEGVETREDAVILKSLGCEMAQGYHFAKPMSEADIIALLPTWKNTDI